MTQHTRTSFSRAGDVLDHGVEYLTHILALLDEARERTHPERVRLLLESFEAEQRNLLGALERYVDDISDKVLDTFITYSIELPETLAGPAEPLTNLGLTQWLVGLNQHLIEVFSELAATGTSTEAREVFAGLSSQVQGHDRRLSKEYQRFEDL